MKKGYIQVYTGKGKGKTTASLGLSLRAAGSGLRVFIAQFVKKRRCGEHRIIEERLGDLITIKQFGAGFIRDGGPTREDVESARKGLRELMKVITSGVYDVVILDEVNVAVHHGLIGVPEVMEIMDMKPRGVELVLTGRYADPAVIDRAHLVTEMNEVSHYWKKGVKARRGIEW